VTGVASDAAASSTAAHAGRADGGRNRARKVYLLGALVVLFLTLGVPRFLGSDPAPVDSHTAANLSKLCRDHGGTPVTAPVTGTTAAAETFCTVRYGGRVYRMDAITSNGFDADTARFQRAGCEEEQRGAGPRQTFVYHPTTGVCEHRS
jgi:hypothetical protein